ncbi:SIR2 family NAD-dependent protein deacylase [Bifidobacterium moukalabense]|uniref:SIR2 family NAD-dependent protein deacylase n=1 Tax=Bifidobacterium moukalabense TaxID=1333651 RepID=UPI001BB1175B|nr:Sir2 silent information regulator family NAD-dependent deacetylase [Bifidobacterium moukalabense]
MSSPIATGNSMNAYSPNKPENGRPSNEVTALAQAWKAADCILIGAGSGLSTSAGYTYSGERFDCLFADFKARYGITDMYSGGFHPFGTLEEYWAWWSREIYYNRYIPAPKPVHERLLDMLRGFGDAAAAKDYFVLTTNVDHCFQHAGFDKSRLFYTQGDYGLWQCSLPCSQITYDNEETVRRMLAEQSDMRIPSELIPHCPRCGRPMTMNLRADGTFVEDAGWHDAARRYSDYVTKRKDSRILLLELGVGGNTPGIIKYPFWQLTDGNPQATYACLNLGEAVAPRQIHDRSICINADIDATLTDLAETLHSPFVD